MKKFKRVLALILSIVVTATVADIPVTVNATPPAGETYEDYDVVTYADLLDTGNHSLAEGGTTLTAQNNLFHYTATSSTHSAIYKFRYVAGSTVYFQIFPGAYRSGDPFAYRLANATTYEKRYAPNAATQAVGHTIVEDEIIDFEIGRLMVATGTNAGNYYTYLKANDTLIFEGYATSSQISGTDLDDSIQLNLNGSNSCTITATPAPEPETYYDYDEVSYYDLRNNGNMLADEVYSKNVVYTYDKTSEYGSAILKFRLKAITGMNMQIGFDTLGEANEFAYRFGVQIYSPDTGENPTYPNGHIWLRPGYNDSTNQVALPTALTTGNTYDIEFARLKVKTGPNTGKYYVYFKMDDVLVAEDYVDANVVDGGGNYSSMPTTSAVCTISNKVFFNVWGDGSSSRITETPEPQRYYDYDEVTYYDMRYFDGGASVPTAGVDLGSNQKLKYNVTSATHSAILKFRWTAGSTPRFAFYFDAWNGTAYPFCFVVKNPGYTDLGGDAGEYGAWHVYPSVGSHNVHMDSPIVVGKAYDIEFARLKVANGKYKNQYLVYLKVDGELIHSYYFDGVKADGSEYTGSNGTGTFSEQLRFNSSAAGNVISAIPVPETFEAYDDLTFDDLLENGVSVAGQTKDGSHNYTYNATSPSYSMKLKYRWTAGETPKFTTYLDAWVYPFCFAVKTPNQTGFGAAAGANGAWHLVPSNDDLIVQMDEPIVAGQDYDIEIGRLKVATGANAGKYYVYFMVDGELIQSYYYSGVNNGVYGSGTALSNMIIISAPAGNKFSAIPVPETFEAYDDLTFDDLLENGVSVAGQTKDGSHNYTYNATSPSYSMKLKYRWTAGSETKFTTFLDDWVFPFCFAAKLPDQSDFGAAAGPNGAWHLVPSNADLIVQMDEPIVAGQDYDIEIGRLKVATGANTGKYYVYFMVDGELIQSYYYSGVNNGTYGSGTALSNKIIISASAGNKFSAIPIPVTYEDYDEIGYDDLTLNGDPVSDTGTNMSGATVFGYTPTSATGSAILKYRWKVGSSANFQMSFEKTSATAMEYMFGAWLYAPDVNEDPEQIKHPNGHLWLRPSYGPDVDLSAAITPGSKHNVEFGRLKIKTGSPAVVGKYYLYLKIDDVLIAEDYVAANVVDANGDYTSNPGPTACNVLAGEIIMTFWGSSGNVVSAYKEPLPNGHQGISGDFDDDGIVNSGDVILLRKILAGALGISELPAGIADFNSDGSVNLLDLIELKLYLAHTVSDTYSRSSALVLGTQEHLLEDSTKTAAYIADASATLGADAYRLSMPIRNLYYATSSNGVGVYSDKMAELKSMVAALKAQGIDKILYVSDCFLLPYDYYNGTTNHANTVPDPTTDPENYLDWLIVNAAAFGALAEEVPEIKYFEPYNEINLSDKRIEKPGIPWDASAAQQASHKYTVDEKAGIMADICWHISKAVKAVDSRNQVTTPSISVADASIVQNTFLDALYDAIESGGYPVGHTVGDVNIDNYFTIVNLHLYPEFTDNNPATKLNAFASRLNSAYSIMQSHKDGGAPVWLTETGVSSYHGDGAPRNENTAGTILTLALNKINTNLTFIDTVFVYKIADISTSVGQTLCESGYGLFYSGDASSNRYVAKPTAKAVYSFFNGGTTDYSALTALTNRYN